MNGNFDERVLGSEELAMIAGLGFLVFVDLITGLGFLLVVVTRFSP